MWRAKFWPGDPVRCPGSPLVSGGIARAGAILVLGIDPGPTRTGFAVVEHPRSGVFRPVRFGVAPTAEVRELVRGTEIEHVAVEMIAPYGKSVGAEVFATCLEIGRFVEVRSGRVALVPRRDVKLALRLNVNSNDAGVRAALLRLFGPKGTRSNPGPCYGMAGDAWAAAGVAVAHALAVRSGRVERLP